MFHFTKVLLPVDPETRSAMATLELRGTELEPEAAKYLVKDVLPLLPKLKKLIVPTGIQKRECTNPIPWMDLCKNKVDHLDLYGIIGGVWLLPNPIQSEATSCLKHLDLSHTRMGIDCLHRLGELLVVLQTLVSLSLVGITVGSDAVVALVPFFMGLQKLQMLDLSQCGLGGLDEKSCHSLFCSLPKSLVALDLKDNCLGWYECVPFQALAAALEENVMQGLSRLGLAGNELRGKCLEDGQGVGADPKDYLYFARALPPSIRVLDMSRNGLGMYEGAGSRALAPCLKEIKHLQMLHLGSNYLEPVMEQLIENSLPPGCQLIREEILICSSDVSISPNG